jgi:hypothetical protein
MDYLNFPLGCPSLHFYALQVGHPILQAAYGHLLPLWTPHAVRLRR